MGIHNDELWGSRTFGGDFMRKLLAQPPAFLLVLWGWTQCIGYFRFFFVRWISFSFATCKTLEYLTNGLSIVVFLFTVNYLWVHRAWFKRPDVQTLATLWLAWFVSMVFVNLMQMNVLHHVVFELQHAIFMLLTGLAVLLTGSLIQNKWMRWGGVLFLLLAFGASFTTLKYQMLLESLGWAAGFILPGHLLMRKK